MSIELLKKLNYQFNKPELLKTALTHRSKSGNHNERLEYLGDSVVNFIIAEALYQQFPEATEGELSRWRATLVNRDTLADLAKKLELGKHIHLGPGELKSGGSERHSILSCTMEAIIGAIYLDAGFEATQKLIIEWYKPLLQNLSQAGSHKDPKTLLQEYLQSRHLPLPVYSIEVIQGEAHKQIFNIRCEIAGVAEKTIGRGTSRRRAEQEAALAMLGKLQK